MVTKYVGKQTLIVYTLHLGQISMILLSKINQKRQTTSFLVFINVNEYITLG